MTTRLFIAVCAASVLSVHPALAQDDVARWQHQAAAVTIIRDTWGIAHVYGHTDADAVFGMIYAQAEDDFNRVEMNFVNALGRAAETEGAPAVWKDLRMKLFIDPDSLKAMYARSPGYLQALMTAWADGLNYYLYTHQSVKPKVIKRFEPWMALSFSEGSIGGDIERISLRGLEDFYGLHAASSMSTSIDTDDEPTGSNGIAIAPSKTANHHTLLLINPHTSFFFRSELQMNSDEGLKAYGAVTWGQFFIYQGFNENAGWMHTSSNVDNIDEYLETVTKRGERYVYQYGAEQRPVILDTVVVPYRTESGMTSRTFTVYRTHHGPIIRQTGDKWVAIRLMQDPVKALTQSYTRIKARDYAEFRRTMELHTNSSNNTIFADGSGDIAYFHANFIPRRDTSFDWSKPVDGSNPATEWGELLSVEQSPLVLNPPNGWVYNTNNWPYTAAGANSPKRSAFPKYVDPSGDNFRGLHAVRVLESQKTFTLESLRAGAYDSYLTGFAKLLPPLIAAYDSATGEAFRSRVAEQIEMLRGWDYRWGASSVPTTVAVFWGDELGRSVAQKAREAGMAVEDYMVSRATPDERLHALAVASDTIAARFGNWRTPWGEVNRFQRLTDDIEHPFSDAGPSIPGAFTSSRWGSLASFGARTYRGSKRIYGTSGNSFVAVVEFGPDGVRARAVTAGGESGDVTSPHFNDQAQRYATGDLREVYFYRPQVESHAERTYHPGQ